MATSTIPIGRVRLALIASEAEHANKALYRSAPQNLVPLIIRAEAANRRADYESAWHPELITRHRPHMAVGS